jgi:hypothetical protein
MMLYPDRCVVLTPGYRIVCPGLKSIPGQFTQFFSAHVAASCPAVGALPVPGVSSFFL